MSKKNKHKFFKEVQEENAVNEEAVEAEDVQEEAAVNEEAGTVEDAREVVEAEETQAEVAETAKEESVIAENTKENAQEEVAVNQQPADMPSLQETIKAANEKHKLYKSHEERSQETAKAMEKDAKREARRRRRIRNQILSYVVIVLLLAGLATGGFYLVQFAKGMIESKGWFQKTEVAQQDAEQPQEEPALSPEEQTEEIIQDLLGQEEALEAPTEEPESTEPTMDEIFDGVLKDMIAQMSIEDKVAGLFIVTPESLTGVSKVVKAGNGTKDALAKYAVGGILYSSKNITSSKQFTEMMETTKSYTTYPTFLAVEEEGGKTASIVAASKLGNKEESAAEIYASKDPYHAYQAGYNLGAILHNSGVNMNLGPVADLSSVDGNVLGDRAYGPDPMEAFLFVNSMMRGFRDQSVTPCAKYFPGLGSSTENPEKGKATSDRSAEDFQNGEFLVYREAIDAETPMIMMSNLIVPSLDPSSVPASVSEPIVSILRSDLGFDGVIVSGKLNEAAISSYYAADEAAIMALKAGCDMILCPEDFPKAYEGVLGAVANGVIAEERIDAALLRVYRIKYEELEQSLYADEMGGDYIAGDGAVEAVAQ